MGARRVFLSLPAEFVRSQMIGFSVGLSGGGVGVGCQVMEFSSSIVRALGHDLLLTGWMQANGSRPFITFIVTATKEHGLHPCRISATGMKPEQTESV